MVEEGDLAGARISQGEGSCEVRVKKGSLHVGASRKTKIWWASSQETSLGSACLSAARARRETRSL
ncbi:hypothetical protein B5F41_00280 [Gordonibacter sp. An232A]|nr:hypothetical protein B5F41_00280 [Gordonibacter sp. An232A]